MSSPSWLHLAIGVGLTTAAVAFVARGASALATRFVNVRKTTVRIVKNADGTFTASSWGEGIAFSAIPSEPPLASYTFSQGMPLAAEGHPNVIAFLHAALPEVNVKGLFAAGAERCERPGCAV